jgi:hypothetical protein
MSSPLHNIGRIGASSAPTPLETDNTTATGYINGTIKQKRTKAMDMVYWGPGYQHLADYFTKHHSPAHHKRMRKIYIHASEWRINRKGIRDSAL